MRALREEYTVGRLDGNRLLREYLELGQKKLHHN
jgi:hypothetical protein